MLQGIASKVRVTQRASPEIVRAVILALCEDRFLSLKELSELLDRKTEALRASYVTPMLREGLLTLKYPDTPSHPDQEYKTHGNQVRGIDVK